MSPNKLSSIILSTGTPGSQKAPPVSYEQAMGAATSCQSHGIRTHQQVNLREKEPVAKNVTLQITGHFQIRKLFSMNGNTNYSH